ncbi:MAG: LysE/ArgO family amino acid transporter [Ancalomicrobiaceae bacterium]|nr:LysE/ArgO family amino acid transporter [Ancalomicrobiaceae bacterium]
MILSVYLTGLTMGFSLIVAIGAQNAFVLRQGLSGGHVFAVCLTCALSDAVLICLGVTGFRQIAAVMPSAEPAMRYLGAAFLAWYGAKSLYSAVRSSDGLAAGQGQIASLGETLACCLVFTWANPHAYIDTIVLLGAISTQFPGQEGSFAAGATTASFLFFFALGYGASLLRPLFAKPASWRVLDTVIAATMWTFAFVLVR